MFVVFSTTYTTGHVQGLNTDFLDAAAMSAGAYLMARSLFVSMAGEPAPQARRWLALMGGVLAGIAFQVNPKAVFDLVFFAVAMLWFCAPAAGATRRPRAPHLLVPHCIRCVAIAGFAAGSLPFLAYLAARRSLGAYWRYILAWGSRYAATTMRGTPLCLRRQTVGYFALNNTLLVGLAFVATQTVRTWRANRRPAWPRNRLPEPISIRQISLFRHYSAHLVRRVLYGTCRGREVLSAATSSRFYACSMRDRGSGSDRNRFRFAPAKNRAAACDAGAPRRRFLSYDCSLSRPRACARRRLATRNKERNYRRLVSREAQPRGAAGRRGSQGVGWQRRSCGQVWPRRYGSGWPAHS